MDEDSRTAGKITHRFLRVLGICILATIASLGLTERVNATYFHSDVAMTIRIFSSAENFRRVAFLICFITSFDSAIFQLLSGIKGPRLWS